MSDIKVETVEVPRTIVSEISVEFTFDAGHRIVGHKGKCARLHGHTYKVHIMAQGPMREPGFVADFGDIKEIVNEWDHRMLFWNKDPFILHQPVEEADWWRDEYGVVLLSFNPTAENMAHSLAWKIETRLQIPSVMVELWETPNCMARCIAGELYW